MKALLDALFPRRCIFCGGFMDEPGEVCSQCEEDLPRLSHPLCQSNMGAVERLYCAFYYDGTVPQGIANLKFRGKSHLHRWFAEQMMESMGKELQAEEIDLVTCVPMHSKRRRRRGYNQAQLLAQEVAYLLNVPYSDCLKKVKLTKEQHRLSAKDRRMKQRNSYACSPLNGEKILLIDDVCTSGETMKECARVLKTAGASVVIGATICRTPRIESQPVEGLQDLWYS